MGAIIYLFIYYYKFSFVLAGLLMYLVHNLWTMVLVLGLFINMFSLLYLYPEKKKKLA